MPRCLVLAVACLFVGLQAHAETAVAPLADPRAAAAVITGAVAVQDADVIAGLYMPHAILLGPGQPEVTGQAAIRDLWAGNFAAGFQSLTFSDIATDRGADRAAVLWTWTASIAPAGQPVQVLQGRSLVYFELTPEGWRISADMWQPVP